MMLRKVILAGFALALASCGGQSEPQGDTSDEAVAIRSTDFVVLPCANQALTAPCALVVAGGKRVLFGAPAGVSLELEDETLRNLDAVLLLSLRGEDVEGLDEVRNASWKAGREGPLPIGGPDGTGEFIGALNRAYEISDALIFVEERPAGGFDAALLALLPGDTERRGIVLDTGDLRVTKHETGASRAVYFIDYAGYQVVLVPCGAAQQQAPEFDSGANVVLSCDSGWALEGPIFVYQAE